MDFRNRDMSKPETFRLLWLREQYSKLRKMLTPEEASDEDIQKLLLGKYLKRRIVTGRFFNNVTEKTYQMSQEDFINLFLNKPYIMSGYGVLFENQDNSENIATDALQYLLTSRKEYKKKMVQSEYGSNEYLYYKVNQQVLKVLANSYYGILGEKNSIFYNPYIQNSITLTGQDLITTAIVATENFLSGNVNFRDTDDVMTFVSNVLGERYSENIIKYIDYPKTRIDVLNYLRSKTKDFDEAAIGSMLSKLGPEDLNRIYYKNNLQELLGNQWFHDRFGEMLRYDYKEEPAPEMKPLLDDMKSKIMEFCYYDYMIQDRFSHAQHDMRKSIITVDTDSTFIDVGNEVKKAIKIYSLNPADEIKKMTVTNIYINIMTEVLKRTFWTVTTNMGLIDRCKPIINMKNELTKWLLQAAMPVENSFNCWNRKQSAAKPWKHGTFNDHRKDMPAEMLAE